jgi:hypothetical protein
MKITLVRTVMTLLTVVLLAWSISCNQTGIRPDGLASESISESRPRSFAADELDFRSQRLGSYNVDISQSSVSGLSAGGYMADQFFVAFSDDIVGAGIFAGGPYGCSQGDLNTATGKCMGNLPPITLSDIEALYDNAEAYADAGKIDSLDNLQHRKVYIFSGTLDQTVKPEVVDWVDNWFERAGMPASNILYEKDIAAGHTQPTLDYGNPCKSASASPWMSDCDYDGAGEALKHIYGNLNPKSPVTDASGTFIEFPQNEFFKPRNLTKSELKSRYSFNEFGYAYVPQTCQEGDPCKIHVVFHGCKQIYDRNPNASDFNPDDDSHPFGLQMVKRAGYNEWANTNHLIILYPQAQKTAATPYIGGLGNPRGCYDWWAYIDGTTDTYATKESPQMAAVYAMMERVAGAPAAAFDKAEQEGTDIVVEGTVSDENDVIAGLEIEFIYDGNASTGKKPVNEFTEATGKFRHAEAWPRDDTAYTVKLTVTYADKPPYDLTGPEIDIGKRCRDWTATNASHQSAGRATRCWFWFNCAVGSSDFLGFGGTTTTVSKEDPHREYYKRGACLP